MYEVDRLTFLMALVKQTGNSNGMPDPEDDDDLWYFLSADEKSGDIKEYNPYTDEYLSVFGF